MNQNIFEANLRELSGEIKKRWAKLTNDDITAIEGELDMLIAKIQQRYGLAEEEVKEQVRQWKIELDASKLTEVS